MRGITFITRWGERTPHPFFLKTCEQDWSTTQSKLCVAYSGETDLDEPTQQLIASGRAELFDCREGNLRLPEVIRRCYEKGIKEGYEWVGLLDDDACLGTHERTIKRIDHLLSYLGEGATGPMNSFRYFLSYKSKGVPEADSYQLKGSPWCSLGAQFYSTRMLKETESHWQPFLKEAGWRSDFPIFMFSALYGYRASEFFIPGYLHSASQATTYNESAEDHYLRRTARIVSDYEVIQKHVLLACETDEERKKYLKDVVKIRRYEYQNLRKRILKSNSDPGFPVYWKVEDYIHAKENGL